MQLKVNLKERSYPIIFNHNAFDLFPFEILHRFEIKNMVLVTNTTLKKLYGSLLKSWQKRLNFKIFVIPDGEEYKTIETWKNITEFFLKSRLDRKSIVIAFGGGVVGDVTGFACATYMRGIRYIQIPTTLLAMVDSSVGGKTGVNHTSGKNLIGCFHQPSCVWLDIKFLSTLPKREFIAGYAELFKYAFIGGKQMFDFVKKNTPKMLNYDAKILLEGIKRSLQIKASIVEQDEKETSGRRALLNFGHTFAHALETYYNYKNILHGEAVIWGIKCACNLGIKLKIVPTKLHSQYWEILKLLPDIKLPHKPDIKGIYNAMFTDKKMEFGKLRFVLPKNFGESVIVTNVSKAKILDVLKILNQ